jgi:hypothetical protein
MPLYLRKKKNNVNPVSDWLKARDFRNNRLWQYSEGVLRTKVGGKWMTAKDFDKRFPSRPPLHFYGNPENPDKRKSFMY